jgi:hypothetical protein
MHSLNTKIFLTALGFAVLATPALAQPTRHRQVREDYRVPQSAPLHSIRLRMNGIQMVRSKAEAKKTSSQAPRSIKAARFV